MQPSPLLRHCERSEAIHSAACSDVDCFAALAMTARVRRANEAACRDSKSEDGSVPAITGEREMVGTSLALLCPPYALRTYHFGLESGGQSGDTFSGLPPLCTVGAAEFEPPASGSTALFSMAIELAVFSSPLPVVAAGEVVQAVSGLSPDAAVDCADAVPTLNIAAKIAAATWIILVSDGPETACPEENVLVQRWFRGTSAVGEDVR